MNAKNSIGLLHISDLHFGMFGQNWLMPTFKAEFFRDLEDVYKRAGKWDFVVFSGDLTQKGTKEEYDALTQFLLELWGNFSKWGFRPSLFLVPGNHDLVRPSEDSAYIHSLENWWSKPDLNNKLFSGNLENYKAEIEKWFSNYTSWIDGLSKSINILQDAKGFFPGDSSAVFRKADLSVGLVGLNSTWLQCSSSNFMEKLSLHPKQINSVTQDNPSTWIKSNDFNIIVTHHPYEWLHSDAKKNWDAEISPAGRFDAHLYGHMHISKSFSIGESGSQNKNRIQSASLFGLENYGRKNEEREHGYSVIFLNKNYDSRYLRIWPRRLIKKSSGARVLSANQDWHLISDSYCDIPLSGAKGNLPPVIPTNKIINFQEDINLSRLCKPFKNLIAHSSVRASEYSVITAELRATRVAWLVADWGMGGDEFTGAAKKAIFGHTSDIYFVDAHQFSTEFSIEEIVKDKVNCSINSFCEKLSMIESAFLVLDDFPVDLSPEANKKLIECCANLEQTIKIILDYCPSLNIIIRSRINPKSTTKIKTIELNALDEAETTQYVSLNEDLGGMQLNSDISSKIYRHTDGIPQRVDAAIAEIEIMGLNGLINANPDFSGRSENKTSSFESISIAVNELAISEEEAFNRAYELLKVLSIFPKGVQLQNIKRFYGGKAFWKTHADILIKKAFIDPLDVQSFETRVNSLNGGKALVARRPVREFIYQSLTESELKSLTDQALKIYFGSNWDIIGIRTPAYLKLDDSNCEAREIVNLSTMVLREFREAVIADDEKRLSKALSLVNSFAAEIKNGGHYRHVVNLYDDFFQILEGYTIESDLFLSNKQFGESLRMIGEIDKSIKIMETIENYPNLNKSKRQSIYLTLALAHEKKGDNKSKAIEYANKCTKINSKNSLGIQARGIIAEHDPIIDKSRSSILFALQLEAEKKGATVVANNIALIRASEARSEHEKLTILEKVYNTQNKTADAYNYIRSTLRVARISLDKSKTLTNQLLMECISAYQYLHNQRLDNLFSTCHSILWTHFIRNNELENLLNLFRHSSLVWRLRGLGSKENEYIQEILPSLSNFYSLNMRDAQRNVVYFMTRISENRSN